MKQEELCLFEIGGNISKSCCMFLSDGKALCARFIVPKDTINLPHWALTTAFISRSKDLIVCFVSFPDERCLDGETYMKDLIQLNPAAEWVIRTAQR